MALVWERSRDILRHLRQDSRKSLAAIAREEKLAVSTVFDHVKKLEENIITKHTALLDYRKLGYPFRTFFYCEHKDPEGIATIATGSGHANNIYLISKSRVGMDMVFATLQQEEAFREQLQERGCTSIEQHKVLAPVSIEAWIASKSDSQ